VSRVAWIFDDFFEVVGQPNRVELKNCIQHVQTSWVDISVDDALRV
jgi:hypothetical protein